MRISDWSSDVCSSDLLDKAGLPKAEQYSVFLQAVCASCREKDGRIPLKEVLPRGIMQVLRDRHQAVFLRLPEMLREKIPPVPGKGRLMPQVQELPAPEVPGGLTEEPVYIDRKSTRLNSSH